ncbi:MAG: rubredoxin [Mycobacteriaceae bacterium]
MSTVSLRPATKSWMCLVCGWMYHEELGSPEEGIPPGTRWEDVPESWVCPECGAVKEDFVMEEL